jgi:hypothetical protein
VSESLIIEGKQYISARRAAEIAAYSNDYVGQLCRSGKLACRMVGRFWYVDESSLRKHKEESFKANQGSFGANGFTAKTSTSVNSTSPSISGNGTISIDPISTSSFLPVFKQAFFVALAVIAVLVGGMTAVSIGKPFLPQTFSQDFSQSVANNSASVYSAMSTAGEILHSYFNQAYSNIASIVSSSSRSSSSASLPPPTSTNESNQSGNYFVANAGLVVVPSSASTTNAKLAQTITNSFSDNVTVTPGPNGTTGVITPEFRNVQGHDFLYMLVPVKTGSSTTASDLASTTIQNDSQ